MTKIDDVYKKFGETGEAAQLLEAQLGNTLLKIRVDEEYLTTNQNKKLARSILTKIERSTLGGLLNSVKKVGGWENLESLFQKALNERNRLSHSFYREHNFRRNSNEGCEIMIKDLKKMYTTILEAYKISLILSGHDIGFLDSDLPEKHLPI